jgi:outer membrane lipoprotein-sorting protein
VRQLPRLRAKRSGAASPKLPALSSGKRRRATPKLQLPTVWERFPFSLVPSPFSLVPFPFSLFLLTLLASGCGAKHFEPPTGTGTPFPDYAAALDQAREHCGSVKTMSVTLSLSGRAGAAKLRGRVDAGLAAPDEIRLEGRAPFGRPVFILVARDASTAMLWLPRDNRVLREAPPAAIVEALAGVALGPDELRMALAGCGFGSAPASDARAYGDWVAVDVADGSTHYLRRSDSRWRLFASTHDALTIEYRDFTSSRPAIVRMSRTITGSSERQTDLTVKLSDVELNVPLGAEVFQLDVPPDADPLTLEELRRAGPLGEAR